jgi:hypothetical protein
LIEEVADMDSNYEDDYSDVLHSSGRMKLPNHTIFFAKMRSTVFRSELTKKRETPFPENSMICCFVNIKGVEHPNKERILGEMITDEEVHFIGLTEIITSDFTPKCFRKITRNRNFFWQHIAPTARTGVLLEAAKDMYEHIKTRCGDHFIRMLLMDKSSKMKCHLIVVYGPTQLEGKENFLAEFA